MAEDQTVDTISKSSLSYLKWSSFCYEMLRNAEKKLLQFLKSKYRGFYVDIGNVVGDNDKVWTISLNESSKNIPLVLLHGLGAGSALWVLNLDHISRNRPVYSIDILGFGRSSRPDFDKEGDVAEMQFIRSINEWRREMNIRKMILCGHSFGSYLACSYALVYPNHIHHLILADPWGFPEKPADANQKYNVPFWVKAIAYAVQPLNPLWAIRAAGPFGQSLVEKMRPDIMRKFKTVVKDETAIPQYIYQCNAQKPAGESAFHSMMSGFGWAKNPMIKRIDQIRDDVNITLIYGSKSWVDHSSGEVIKKARAKSYVKVHVIQGAGHHVYADQFEEFNSLIYETCEQSCPEEEKNGDDDDEEGIKIDSSV